MQIEAGGIAQVVGMARNFAAGEGLVVCPRRQHLRARADRGADRLGQGDGRALIFVTEVSDPENFGVVVYGENGSVEDIVEKAGVVDTRYAAPPSNDAVVGLYCYPPDVFDDRRRHSSRRPAASSRSPTSTARTPRKAASTCTSSRAGGTTAASIGGTSPRSASVIGETGVNK